MFSGSLCLLLNFWGFPSRVFHHDFMVTFSTTQARAPALQRCSGCDCSFWCPASRWNLDISKIARSEVVDEVVLGSRLVKELVLSTTSFPSLFGVVLNNETKLFDFSVYVNFFRSGLAIKCWFGNINCKLDFQDLTMASSENLGQSQRKKRKVDLGRLALGWVSQ